MESVNNRIKQKRVELGLSQYELAERVKTLNQSQISKIESGSKKTVSVENLIAISKALNTPVNWFITQNKEEMQ